MPVGREWLVVDAERRPDRSLKRAHAGSARAIYRYFIRYAPANGLAGKEVLELRRYRFRPGEDRALFRGALAQRQLELGDVRTKE